MADAEKNRAGLEDFITPAVKAKIDRPETNKKGDMSSKAKALMKDGTCYNVRQEHDYLNGIETASFYRDTEKVAAIISKLKRDGIEAIQGLTEDHTADLLDA